MHRKPFHFKQFSIHHDKCSMKVGTDGVLLGAWANVSTPKKVLDVGTGTGLIAIMMAQRGDLDTTIEAIEIEKDAYLQAIENIENCPWHNQITVIHSSIQAFTNTSTSKYDLIISNPPFFLSGSKSENQKRNIARHTQTLSHEDLIYSTDQLLSSGGKFSIILPIDEGEIFIEKASQSNLFCSRITKVKPKVNKPFERMLMEFIRSITETKKTELIIQFEKRNDYTPAYIELTQAFYTIM
ncbi:MAG: methyltransferase [Cyclobacteriaceae bacterium]|nr:methyltransferase [Cyclobacteriaceae bacterium]